MNICIYINDMPFLDIHCAYASSLQVNAHCVLMSKGLINKNKRTLLTSLFTELYSSL